MGLNGIMEIVLIIGFSVIIGVIIDYLLFRWWHKVSHSKYLMEQEKERKKMEYSEKFDDDY